MRLYLPDPYLPLFRKLDGSVDTDAFIAFYAEFLTDANTKHLAACVIEPIQGWGGSVIPPGDFFPKLRAFCDRHKMLLIADEVLTCMGRTGRWLAMEHWKTLGELS